ncbi:hypothetical protein QWZ16_24375 [Vibrio ostreicida]|uniref:Glutamine amidotransferase type-2 domain-containing protein n=1 Tax=Vibrio ostreicida TaxID=526588 RepID=A0ABT8C2Y1_9VIBR|nr:hypothetical protein [Vibrio ostreicida]MDN3612712.1 hypothetical protein [Vibrio ostreicida]
MCGIIAAITAGDEKWIVFFFGMTAKIKGLENAMFDTNRNGTKSSNFLSEHISQDLLGLGATSTYLT